MNRCSFLIVVFVLSLTSIGFTQTTQTISLNVAGATRSCVVHVPSGINKPALVLLIHGAFGNGAGFENDTRMDVVADREKFIAVYPSSSGSFWDMQTTSEFPFLLAVIDTIDARYHIDRDRVYCTGFSQGGFISFGVGCVLSDVFAAVAPVSGHIPDCAKQCTPKRPVPILITFGTNDYGISNGDVSSFMNDINAWLKSDSCSSTPTRMRPYPPSNPKSWVTRVTYEGAQGSEVMYDSIVGGGHEWAMDTSTKVNTSEEVWAFFKKFSLKGNTTDISQKTFSVANESISASYSSGIVRLQGQGIWEKSLVRVIDTKGRLVASVNTVQNQFAFKNKSSGIYMIMLRGNSKPATLKMVIP